MGGSSYPTLDVQAMRALLRAAGFAHVRTKSSHETWEGTVDGRRQVVTLDTNFKDFHPSGDVTRSMIRQAGMTAKQFYAFQDKPAKQPKAKDQKASERSEDAAAPSGAEVPSPRRS